MDFVKNRVMQFPRDVYVGHEVLHNLIPIAKNYTKNRKISIITGHNSYSIIGKQIAELLSQENFEVEVLITGDATELNVREAIDFIKGKRSGLVIGIGGGSKIDIAKIVSKALKIPHISFPTIPSHDGIASPRATIKREGGYVSEQAVMPIAIIADTSIMVKAPFRYLASGAADVISNITAVLDWKLAARVVGEEYSSSAATLSEYASTELIEKAHLIQPGIEEAVWLVVKQILASGTAMAIASSSRPASGSEHLFAHSLEKHGSGDAMHGEQCAMGSVVSLYMHGGDWQKLVRTYSKFGLSIRAEDYGISASDAVEALRTAHSIRPDRYTIFGTVDLSEGAARRSLEITGII